MKRSTVGWLILGGVAVGYFLLRPRMAGAVQDWEVRMFLSRISPHSSIISQHSERNVLDEDLVKGIIWKESSGFPNAINWEGKEWGFSRGLMGLLYTTAEQMGYTGDPDGLFESETNLRYGTDYLRWQLDRYGGKVRKAVSAYNAGTYTEANRAYVDRVLEYYSRLKEA